jgi:hypothetical protein
MHIRRTVYCRHGQQISLAYFSGIDGHPEVVDDAPPPTPPQPKVERGRP